MKSLYISTIIVTSLVSGGAKAEGLWTDWALDNMNGSRNQLIQFGNIETVRVREQAGYGIVNLKTRYENGSQLVWSSRATTNNNGTRRDTLIPQGGKSIGIQVAEQHGYGVINLRVLYRLGDSSEWSSWVTNNNNANAYGKSMCQRGYYLRGLQVREQAGYGIVNIRAYCVAPTW